MIYIKKKNLRYFKFLLLCFCVAACLQTNAQKKVKASQVNVVTPTLNIPAIQDDFVKLSGEVKLIDSQYILILKLSVTGKNEIRVGKIRDFDPGENRIASNRLFLNKRIRASSVHIYPDGIGLPMFSEDWDKKIKITSEKPIIDSLDISSFYPLETGQYFISVQEDYWNKTSKHTAQIFSIPFTVLFLPKKMYN